MPIGFAAVMALLVAVFAVGTLRLENNIRAMEQAVNDRNHKTNLVMAMYTAIRQRSALLFGMVNYEDAFERDDAFMQFRELGTRYLVASREFGKLELSEDERWLFDEQLESAGTASRLQSEVVELLADQREPRAADLLVRAAIPVQNEVLSTLGELLARQNTLGEQALARTRQAYHDTMRTIGLLVIVAFAIALLIAINVIRRNSNKRDALFAEVALGSIGDAVITTDGTGRVSYLNATAQELTGFGAAQALGKPLSEICGGLAGAADSPGPLNFNRVLQQGPDKRLSGESMLTSRQGETMPIEFSMSPIRGQAREVIGVVVAFRDISSRKTAEEELRTSEERFALVMRGTKDGIWDFNLRSGEIYFSPRWQEMLGYEEGGFEASFQNWQDHIHPDDLGPTLVAWTDCMAGIQPSYAIEYRMKTRDGAWKWIECRGLALLGRHGSAMRLAGSHTDITERKAAEQALYEAKEHAEVTLQSIGDAVITLNDDGLVTFLNPVAEELTGWGNLEATGMPLEDILRCVDEKTREPVKSLVGHCLVENRIVKLPGHVLLINRDGAEFAIEQSAAPIRDKKGGIAGVVTVIRDVSTERSLKNQLTWQATHDSLTGLVNRREFEQRLDEILDNAISGNSEHALLYLDLDQFKVVNDTCGHVAGDELLRQLAVLLRGHVRASDTLARLGGDEFGLLLDRCSLDTAVDMANGLREAIKDFRFIWDDKTFDVGVSIGVVPLDRASGSRNSVLSAADVACYAAKDLGRNRVHVYEQGNDELASRHGEIMWVTKIRDALSEDRFVLYQQEIVPVCDGEKQVPHAEILVRMVDREGGIVPPGAFIPSAERYNLMPAIDRCVIDKVFSTCRKSADGRRRRVYTINLSGTTINDDEFLHYVKAKFDMYHVRPDEICFEITETSAIANLSNASEFIREMKSLGCLFALDDFGSGLSSFGYLKNLPVDFLKIDGQFVRDMVDDPMDYAMVKSINEIGHVMGMQTIAEFVENDRILEQLREIGVDFAQGYGIGKPAPFLVEDEAWAETGS